MKRIALGVLALIVAAVAAVFIYFNFIREDAPEEFGLTETSAEDGDADSGSDGDGDADAGSDSDAESDSDGDAASSADADGGSLDGTWSVADGSQAGYRVIEDIRGIQDFEAVGRTADVSGTMMVSGTAITEASFEVMVGSITSDDERRDGQFTGPIMSAAEFPLATLTLTEPVQLDALPADNTAISTTATGELTLRDATNPVTITVDAQLLGDQVEIVASVDVLFSDYGIANPTNAFVTVRDEGKVEVQLFLDKG